jgi:hypothetical protein
MEQLAYSYTKFAFLGIDDHFLFPIGKEDNSTRLECQLGYNLIVSNCTFLNYIDVILLSLS